MRAINRLRHALSPLVPGVRWGHFATLVTLVLLAAGPAGAQIFFPAEAPATILSEDFSVDLSSWTIVQDPLTGWTPGWVVTSTGTPGGFDAYWGQHLSENAATSGRRTALLANATAVGYGNLRFDFDLTAGTESTSLGAVWDVDTASDSGYIITFSNFPATDPGSDPDQPHAAWTLVRREGGVNEVVGTGAVNLLGSHGTMIQGGVYRVRVSSFCGNVRVQAQRVYESSSEILFDGGCASRPLLTPDCWDAVIEWSDPIVLAPGKAGLYSASLDGQPAAAQFDNVHIEVWPPECLAGCTNWTDWGEDWATAIGGESRDILQFKLDYESVLQDFLVAYDTDPAYLGRIDCEVGAEGTCDGWKQLVDLPAPSDIVTTADRKLQDEKIGQRLESVATAVKFLSDGGSFSWVEDYNDPKHPIDYNDALPDNPIPVVASGDTPIAASMMAAYDWYVGERSGDGAWAQDTWDACRKWYVLLITDGEESCHGEVCGDGQAADLFAAPDVDVPAVPVSVIGFTFDNDELHPPPIKCLADTTGGSYHAAADALSLADELNKIINLYQVEDRSFTAVTVSPQLSTSLASADTSYLLTVPMFAPRNGKSIWDGHLHTFLLDATHRSPPVDGDGKLDSSSPYWKWDAGAALETQLRGASPYRNLYWPSDATSSWVRVSLADVKTDAARKAEFRALTGDSQITDAVADSVVDFMYFFNDTTDRPADYTALGDIYHSRPVIVGAPRNFKYLLRNLHDYATFATTHENRRRVVFAGGNDGLFHAFDSGRYVVADHAYGTGTGQEMFGVMPQSVMPKLYALAAQSGDREQQYMVDGQISSADVRIDITYTGDPGGSTDANRTWRTIALATMRAGGRSVLALDVTQPDDPGTPPTDADPQPTCLSGGGGCSGIYPRVMWEFTDRTDSEGDCSAADDAAGICNQADYWDLGDTWSKPLIARVKKASDDEMFVAFFGGGNDPEGDDTTGNFLYGVDIETGQIIYKANMGASIPGGIAGLDKDDDGFVDVIYFGTTNGFIYKMDLTAEAVLADDGTNVPTGFRVTNWTPAAMYFFGADVKFFMTPVLVPVMFDANGYRYAIAIGAGDRDNIDQESDIIGSFYFVLDYPGGQRNETNLQAVAYDDPPAAVDANYFNPNGNGGVTPTFGWYLTLRPGEKVSTDAIVDGKTVVFPTFVRTVRLPTDPPDTDADGNVICQASGKGRIYKVDYLNANPIGDTRGTETDLGLITGLASAGGGGTSGNGDDTDYIATGQAAGFEVGSLPNSSGTRVTNWRQE